MFVVVTYDVADDRRRLRIMKLLEGYGEHVQESVFECDLRQSDYEKMLRRLQRAADLHADNIQVYHLCAADIGRTVHMGVGEPARLRPALVIV
jgi:CRISPR-associated protein Cas2